MGDFLAILLACAFSAGLSNYLAHQEHKEEALFTRNMVEGELVNIVCYQKGCSLLVADNNGQRNWQWRNKPNDK